MVRSKAPSSAFLALYGIMRRAGLGAKRPGIAGNDGSL
jgi:hypothetical protein